MGKKKRDSELQKLLRFLGKRSENAANNWHKLVYGNFDPNRYQQYDGALQKVHSYWPDNGLPYYVVERAWWKGSPFSTLNLAEIVDPEKNPANQKRLSTLVAPDGGEGMTYLISGINRAYEAVTGEKWRFLEAAFRTSKGGFHQVASLYLPINNRPLGEIPAYLERQFGIKIDGTTVVCDEYAFITTVEHELDICEDRRQLISISPGDSLCIPVLPWNG